MYYPEKETLEVHWLGCVSDVEILQNMEEVTALFCVMKVKKYVVNLLKVKSFNFPYQQQILERSVKAFYQHGGKGILIVNKKEAPNKLLKIYSKVMKRYGIKLNLFSEKKYANTFMEV